MLDGGSITRSANTGQINGAIAGGIVGTMNNGASLENVYNLGAVSGIDADSIVGGIVGYFISGTIRHAYSSAGIFRIDDPDVGPVLPGTPNVARMGGIVGHMGPLPAGQPLSNLVVPAGPAATVANITDVYFDRDRVDPRLFSIGSHHMAGAACPFARTTAQMITRATYVDFDFQNIWIIREGFTPRLRATPGGQPVTWLVNFHGNGGNLASGNVAQWVADGGDIAAADVPVFTRQGFTFIGWSIGAPSNVPHAGALLNITDARELFAVWQAQDHLVTFHGNGGHIAGGTGNIITQNVPTGGVPTVPNPGFVRAGYNQIGWSTNAAATANDPSAFFAVTANRTIFAIWAPAAETFTVTFDPAGGQWAAGPAGQRVFTVERGGSVLPPELLVPRPFFAFEGWAPHNAWINVQGNQTITAVWRALVPGVDVCPECGICTDPEACANGECCGTCPGDCGEWGPPLPPPPPPPFGGGGSLFFWGINLWWWLLIVLIVVLLLIVLVLVVRNVARSRESKAYAAYYNAPPPHAPPPPYAYRLNQPPPQGPPPYGGAGRPPQHMSQRGPQQHPPHGQGKRK